jgi:putative spermidine/putrescine transport system substrate-binding protein
MIEGLSSPVVASRRAFVAGSIATAATAGFGRSAEAGPLDVVMANSGGDSMKVLTATFGANYEKATGGKMIMDGSGPSNGRIRVMEEAKNVIWDLCDLGPQAVGELGPIGMLSAIDYSIVDRDKSFPEFTYDYGICNYFFSQVLAWDSAAVKRPPVITDFFDFKNFPGKRMVRKDAQPMLELTLMADGVAPDKLYPLDTDRALRKLAANKDNILFWETGTQTQSWLRDGEVVMGFMPHTRANLLKQDTNGRIDWTFGGGVLVPSCWVVPANNPAGKQAMVAIATTQDAATQVALLRALGNGPANPHADALVPPELKASNPSSAANVAVQCKMSAEYWMKNYADNLKAFLAMISS